MESFRYIARLLRGLSWAARELAPWCVRIGVVGLAALLLAGGRGSVELFRCEYTGAVQTSCCCPAQDLSDAGPLVSRACCCSIQQLDASLPAGMAGSSQLVEAAAAPLLVLAPSPSSVAPRLFVFPHRSGVAERYRERTRAGPPLTIVHRRLLI